MTKTNEQKDRSYRNYKTYITLLLTASTIFLAALPLLAAGELDGLKQKYGEMQSVEAQFRQKIFIAALKREREMRGEFYYKRSKGFLWKYTEPKEKLFLYDGTVVWQAEEEKPFVMRTRVDKEKMGGTFLDLIEDVTRLDRYFEVKKVTKEKDLTGITLIPKKEGTIQAARMWVDGQSLIRKMEITEITGNVNTIEFSSIRINRPLKESLFVFEPGKKEIMEGRGLNGAP